MVVPSRKECANFGLDVLARWTREHPDDPYAESEAYRLRPRFTEAA
jgi:hypothetical protein